MLTPRRISAPRTPLRLPLAVLAFLVLWSVAALPAARAQSSDQELIREYIGRNTELLQSARDIVRDTESLPPRQVLRSAAELHQRSQRLLEENHPALALQAARRCREGIRQAVRMARESMGQEERLLQRVERVREQLEHLVDLAREAGNERANGMLMRSRQMYERAQEQYRQGDVRLALQLLDQAEELSDRAARLLAGVRGDRLERRLEMAAWIVGRARESLQGVDDPAARDLLTESEQALERARDFRDQGRPGRALNLAGLAERLARRAMGQGGDAPSTEVVQRQIERWDERASLLSERLGSVGENQRSLLERAREHRQRAADHLSGGRTEPALRQIRAAHDLLGQLEDSLR